MAKPPITLPSFMSHRRSRGLRNLGNTCYLNACIQFLVHNPLWAFMCTTTTHSEDCRGPAARSGFCAACATFQLIKSCLTARNAHLSPTSLHSNILSISTSFRRGRQASPQAFLSVESDAYKCHMHSLFLASCAGCSSYIQVEMTVTEAAA